MEPTAQITIYTQDIQCILHYKVYYVNYIKFNKILKISQ